MTSIIIQTARLSLRQMTEADAVHVFQMNSRLSTVRYLGEPLLASEEEALTILRDRIFPQYNNYNIGRWAVVLTATGEFIGWCGLRYIADDEEYDLGYRFIEEYWGHGYATEAARSVLDYGHKTLPGARIVAKALVENTASIRVIEKIGMRFERYLQEHGGLAVLYAA